MKSGIEKGSNKKKKKERYRDRKIFVLKNSISLMDYQYFYIKKT